MANGPAPDMNAALQQWQAQLNASASSGGNPNSVTAGGALLKIAGLRDTDMMASFSAKGKGFNCDKPLPALFASTGGKQGGLADKIFNAVQSISEDFKKANQGAQAVYSGDITNGTPVSSNIGGSSSFVDNLGPRGGGSMEV